MKEQGGAGEHGADLQVIFEWEVPILGIQEQRICVVQVKSFKNEMEETKAVDQIQKALDHWNADMGIIVPQPPPVLKHLTMLSINSEKKRKNLSICLLARMLPLFCCALAVNSCSNRLLKMRKISPRTFPKRRF